MSIDTTVGDVTHLPRRLSERGDTSIAALLLESGYCATHERVADEAICAALRRNPEVVSDWLQFSETKRTSSDWFLRMRAGCYQIGHYPNGEPVEYVDEFAACAAFIRREIEDIRTDGRGS